MIILDVFEIIWKNMTFVGCVALLGTFSLLYLALIGPLLYRFWIMPRIGKRYNAKLVAGNDIYNMAPFATWGAPPIEISGYIIGKLCGVSLGSARRVMLKKIDYQITKESKPEIIMSFVTLFFLAAFIVAGIVVVLSDK
jgi:hypothetical protein